MDPNQPHVDYLNQIAYTPPTRSPLGRLKPIHYLVGGVIALILIIIIGNILSGIAQGPANQIRHLAARLTTTQTLAENAEDNLKSTELLSDNTSLKIYLTNTNRDITTPLKDLSISPTNISKKITSAEDGSAVAARLEDARLNAVYDRTYAREMDYQLSGILTLMQQIHTSTHSKSLKAFLETATTNLQPIEESFANFSASND